MQPDLDDVGGARELAFYRIEDAKEQLETAREVVNMVENIYKLWISKRIALGWAAFAFS